MCRLYSALFFWLVALGPFVLVAVCVVLAVFGKAYGNFPYQPEETKAFKKYALPRARTFVVFSFLIVANRNRKPLVTEENENAHH